MNKAETMVCLPGFTASPAEEVKSRPFAFKVYHTGTMFYFAAETNFELSVWLDAISTATLSPNPNTQEVIYSESEGEEKGEMVPQHFGKKTPVPPTPAPRPQPVPQPPPSEQKESSKMFGSLKKLGNRSSSNNNSSSGSGSSLDRKCLRILGPGPLPVPTAQYRSYRRVHNTTPTSNSGSNVARDQEHVKLPPEMADYRLASLTAKTTPPVPRRRIMARDGRTQEQTRPHISAPILTHPLPIFDERNRRAPPINNPNANIYRNGPSPETMWIDSLRRSDGNKRKIKEKKSSNKDSSHSHMFHTHHDHAQMQRFQVPEDTTVQPPDYPGLEYPPVFEPGTYTLDALSLFPRNMKNQNQ